MLRILVVDDYEPFQRYLCSTLEQVAEFRVIGRASDGLEAIQKAEELQPDLILLDIGLPKLNGLETARRVRELAPFARILFISQEFSYDMVEAALKLGALGYIHKVRAERDLMPAIEAIHQGKFFVSGVIKEGFGEAALDKPPVRHEVQFCSEDAVLVQSFTDFTAASLRAGKATVMVATESHRQGVLRGLNAQSVDVDSAIKSGILIPVDVTETASTPMLNKMSDLARFLEIACGPVEAATKATNRQRSPRVAVCRECPPLLLAEGRISEALQLEQFWGLMAHISVLDMLCGYPLGSFEKHNDIFQTVCGAHSAIHSR